MKIFKYLIQRGTDEANIDIPEASRIIHVATQGDEICLWAIVNEKAPAVERTFRIYGTGQELPDLTFGNEYLGTVHYPDEGLVWHIFEIVRG